jgi:hypothetical protein
MVLDRVTMQVFVREHCTMIAAPVQCDVDEIPKGSHYVLLKRANELDCILQSISCLIEGRCAKRLHAANPASRVRLAGLGMRANGEPTR